LPPAYGRVSPPALGRASPLACGRVSPLACGRVSPLACGRVSPPGHGHALPPRARVSRFVIAGAARVGGVRVFVLALALAGCGSLDAAHLPPPAGPAPSPPLAVAPAGRVVAGGAALLARDRLRCALPGGRVAVLRPRARVLELRDAAGRRLGAAGAGVGPTAVAAGGRWLYVTDATGGALLVFGLRPRLELVHRVYLPGGPYALAADRDRLWVTLTGRNELAELNVRRLPFVLARLPTIRAPLAVQAAPGSVSVAAPGRLERITPPR
jgi:hypothetical protein